MATGFNLIMNFDTSSHFNPAHRQCDFDREVGKVRIFFIRKKGPEKSCLDTLFLCVKIIRVSSKKLRSVFRISLQIPFSDLCSALFPISMGRMGQGQTSRASSPSTQHQILTQTLERSSKPLSPPKGPALLLPPSLLLLLMPTKLFLPTAAHYSHSHSQSQSHHSQSQTSSS